jgi:hypothetical protein
MVLLGFLAGLFVGWLIWGRREARDWGTVALVAVLLLLGGLYLAGLWLDPGE